MKSEVAHALHSTSDYEVFIMRNVMKYYALAGMLMVFAVGSHAQDAAAPSETDDSAAKAAFEAAVNSYVTQRRELEAGMPTLSTEATAEQLAAHKSALFKNISTQRKAAKRGVIFTPAAEAMIGRIIQANYSDAELANIKAENAEADMKGVKLAINAAYPEGREKVEMPPRLLLALPELPDELNYHFIGRDLIILDKESGLIIDFMTSALP
jgi:hypothetical protein